jgi:putative hydrolase of the HAD superfamily
MELKAITFDLDGTLYPEYRILLPSLGMALRHPRLFYSFSRARKEIRSVAVIRDFRAAQAELVASHLGQNLAGVAERIDRVIYGKWLDRVDGMRPFRGLRELIARLRQTGYRTAVLSDLPIKKKLSYLKMEHLWDYASTSEDAGYLKPHPAPFERMLDALGFRPEEVIYIGNNYRYDVVGASRLGMKTGFFSRRPVPGNVADFTFTRYSQMKDFLASLLSPK